MTRGAPAGAELAIAPPRRAATGTAWVAFSGGLDSTVLLHRLKGEGLALRALHVNHHLQSAANRWVEHCRSVCTQLGVPLYVLDAAVDPADPAGPEAAARAARYAAFASVMRPGDCLVTAHHLDDQAETVLLRLLRGAGVAGLAAMRPWSERDGFAVWRPLLPYSRRDLRQYAERHALPWVEDPHNLDPRYSRSFLRTEIFSRLSERWPGAPERLAGTADHCAEAVELLDGMAAADLRRVERRGGLSVRGLLRLPPARRHNALRAWITARGFEAPPAATLRRVEPEVLRARPDAGPVLAWGAGELRRFRDRVYLMARLPPPPRAALEWDGRRDLHLPSGCGVLEVRSPAKSELPLRVTFVAGGERLRPAGSRYTRTLRNLFQEAGVPPWVRERIPLIRLEGELASVGGRWQTAAFGALCRRERLRLRWAHALPGDPRTR